MLDTVHQSKSMLEYLNHLYITYPLLGLTPPSKLLAMNLIWTLVQENMDARNKMLQGHTTDFNIVRASMLFGTQQAMVNHHQRQFVESSFDTEYIQSLYDDLTDQLNAHQVFGSYNQWTVINTGYNIVLGEEGDVRVLEWEKLNTTANEDLVVSLNLSPVIDAVQREMNKAFGTYPQLQIDALVLEEIQTLFPMLKRTDKVQIGVDYDLAASYGINNISTWSNIFIRKVCEDYNVPSFRQYVQLGVTYDYSFSHKTKVLTVGRYVEPITGEDTDADLARQLMRGDFLRRDERERAERYIQENPCI
jgi:hypothetical protein